MSFGQHVRFVDTSQAAKHLRVLQQSDLFGALSKHHLSKMLPYTSELRLQDNALLFQQGDDCTSLHIIMEGTLVLHFLSETGRASIVGRATCGEAVGMVPCLDNKPYQVNGFAYGHTRLLSISKSGLGMLLEDNPLFRNTVLQLCKSIRHIMQYAELIAVHSLEARLAQTLLILHQRSSIQSGSGMPIPPIPQSQLAMMINASRPKVNVKLREWVARSFIKMHNRRIFILDEGALSDIARR